MDLRIRGRRAIVCASSGGLGYACADALAAEGVHVTINGRDAVALRTAADELRSRHDIDVAQIVGDIGDEQTRAALFDACPEPDILVNNNGGPPPGRFQDWHRDEWVRALDANMITPLLLIQAVIDGMVARRFGRIVNITSAMVKTPVSAMGLSTGARTGLTSMSKALSRDVAAANVTINNLLPERFDTARQRQMAELQATLGGITVDEAYDAMRATIAANRLGRPEEFGAMCAFLCSDHAGFVSGQSIQLDGGSYGGLL